MRIVKGTEPIIVTHPVIMIYGIPGICKSSLSYSADEPLNLDFDHGAHRAVNRRDTLLIDSWKDIEDISIDGLKPYNSVIVDTAGRCLDFLIADIGEKEPKKVQGGTPTLQGWGALKGRFRQWMSFLRTYNKFVILLAHHKEESDGDRKIIRPDIQGGSYSEVMKVCDFVGFLDVKNGKRVLDFNPTDRWVGKNPGQWDPFVIPPIADCKTFLKDLIQDGVKVLGRISEENASASDQVMDWKSNIETLTTAADLNNIIPEVLKLPKVIQSQVSKLLMSRAGEIKTPFDKKKKVFVMPAEPSDSSAGPADLPFK